MAERIFDYPRESHKIKTSKKLLKVNVGDAVFQGRVKEKTLERRQGIKNHRRHWKEGKVLRIITGKDDVIRGAEVQIFI